MASNGRVQLLPFADYIHKWQRVSLCLGCYPFSEAHTGENMAKFYLDTLASFDLTDRNEVTTTDRASNMLNMMTHLPTYYLHAPCINHHMQTAIGVSSNFLRVTPHAFRTTCPHAPHIHMHPHASHIHNMSLYGAYEFHMHHTSSFSTHPLHHPTTCTKCLYAPNAHKHHSFGPNLDQIWYKQNVESFLSKGFFLLNLLTCN